MIPGISRTTKRRDPADNLAGNNIGRDGSDEKGLKKLVCPPHLEPRDRTITSWREHNHMSVLSVSALSGDALDRVSDLKHMIKFMDPGVSNRAGLGQNTQTDAELHDHGTNSGIN